MEMSSPPPETVCASLAGFDLPSRGRLKRLPKARRKSPAPGSRFGEDRHERRAMPLDELAVIDRFFRPLAGQGAFGLLDDAARLDVPPDADLVVTTDMVACGVHFLPGDPPETVARKALRVNVSDLAAKGAQPLAYVISIAISEDIDEVWLAAFAHGLKQDQDRFGIGLLGGDTIEAPGGAVVSITAFGVAPKGRMVHRFGGRPGDALFVSGTIGAGTAGLALLKREPGPWDALTERGEGGADRSATACPSREPRWRRRSPNSPARRWTSPTVSSATATSLPPRPAARRASKRSACPCRKRSRRATRRCSPGC